MQQLSDRPADSEGNPKLDKDAERSNNTPSAPYGAATNRSYVVAASSCERAIAS